MQDGTDQISTGRTRNLRMAGWQAALAVLVLAAGLGATAWVAGVRHREEEERVGRKFEQVADKVFGSTLREIQLFMEVLDSIRMLHSLSDQVTPEAFGEIVRKGMIYQRRILGAYGFAQLIPDDMRREYEGTAGAGRAIVQPDGRGGFAPRGSAAYYYPLTYQTPPGGLGVPVGYDFSAREPDREGIEAMRRWGVFALGGEPPGNAAEEGLYMFAPILYAAPDGGRELAGFAIGLFRPDRILAAAAGEAGQGLRARLERGGQAPAAEPVSGRHFERVFSLANQEWRFVADADPAYWAAERSRAPAWIGAAGATLSVALAGVLWMLAGHSRRIERLVGKRTAQLADANRRLEALMEERRELEDEVLRISGREKARIGRDLHDSLGQKLTGAMFLFKAFRRRAAGTEPEAEQIAATLKDAVSQIRRIARGLAPVALTEDGLPDALRRLAEESAALFQQTIEFYSEREGRPRDAATAEHLYLIAQEALNNAFKHGEPTHIVLTLDFDERGGMLSIEDNGKGMGPAGTDDREGGSGLRIMRHRAEVFGGTLEVGTSPLGGVRVFCRFPAAVL